MGNATVTAEFIAPGRGALSRLGQVCRSALASEDFGGVAARQRFPAVRPRLG